MPKAVGRPSLEPKRVTLSLAAHHAAELENMAKANNVKLSTFCANLLERYSMEQQGVLASEILKTVVVETVQAEMREHHNRVRSLLSRTALESIATRQLARMNLKAQLKEGRADKYNEESWQYAVHSLKNPTPGMRKAIAELSESISQDDPALLMHVRETLSGNQQEIEDLKAQVAQLTEQQTQLINLLNQMQGVVNSLDSKLLATQRYNVEAVERIDLALGLSQSSEQKKRPQTQKSQTEQPKPEETTGGWGSFLKRGK